MRKLVRFIENHVEPRASAAFTPGKHRAFAVTALTLPGAKLVHEGQMVGKRVGLPVFLARHPEESLDTDLLAFYRTLLQALSRGNFLSGTWTLCERSGWPDNHTYRNLVAWCWQTGTARCLIVVNLSDTASQCLVKIPWDDLNGKTCQFLLSPCDLGPHERHYYCSSPYRGLYPWVSRVFDVKSTLAGSLLAALLNRLFSELEGSCTDEKIGIHPSVREHRRSQWLYWSNGHGHAQPVSARVHSI